VVQGYPRQNVSKTLSQKANQPTKQTKKEKNSSWMWWGIPEIPIMPQAEVGR
jgi:hypothetical protein